MKLKNSTPTLILLLAFIIIFMMASCMSEKHIQKVADKTGNCQWKPATRHFDRGFY